MGDAEVPEERCGFVLEPGDVGGLDVGLYEAGSERWYEDSEAACCWREAWDGEDADRCVWHTERDEKPVEELVEARGNGPEQLDATYLVEAELGDAISFEDCRMHAADLGGADLRGADLGGADLRQADIGGANLRVADLGGADLQEADLGSANLWDADLGGADLIGADLGGADLFEAGLGGAKLARTDVGDADLRGADLGDADLYRADLGGANLRVADLGDADLYRADLGDADLYRANLRESNLRDAIFVGANLTDADLTDANLRKADLIAATLEDAVLTRTDIRGADFEYAEHYQTLFSDVQMNNRTEFGDICYYEAEDERPQNDDTVSPLEAAAWTYRRIQTLHEENALAQDAREYHVLKAEAYRKLRWREFGEIWSRPHHDPWQWATSLVRAATYSANRWLSRHGESPHRVVGVSLLVILASTLVYPLFGIRSTEFATPRKLAYFPSLLADAPNPITHLPTVLGKSLYFSVVTFTTVGYGDLQPVGFAQLLATVESFAGALLMALLVFVLGRRATW